MVNDLLAWLVAAVKADLPAFGGRIFPDVAPEGTVNPCMIYQLYGDEHDATLDPGMTGHGTLAYQVRIYGDSRSSANALRDAFRERFEGVSPVAIGSGWKVEGSAFGNLAETYEKETRDYGALAVVEFHLAR